MKQQKGNGYWSIIGYPFSAWLLYLIVFAIAAGAGMIKLGYTFLVGYGAVVMALLFGFWCGINSRKGRGNLLYSGIISGFVAGLVIGLINMLFVIGLSAIPIGFAQYITASGYGSGDIGIIAAAFGTWIEIVLMATLAAAVGNRVV